MAQMEIFNAPLFTHSGLLQFILTVIGIEKEQKLKNPRLPVLL